MATTRAAAVVVSVFALQILASAQAQRQPARGVPLTQLRIEAPSITCPTVLGQGASTGRSYCDVLIGRDPAEGILIPIPPHTGDVILTFDLHNRHTYSEDEIRNKRAYHRYTTSIGVMAMDNTLLSRAVVQSEFRAVDDLVERILGGSGPGGLKAVAPIGLESVAITIPAEEQQVSILGEKLSVIRVDAKDDFVTPGRPIAVISNVRLEYRPGPARRPATRR